MNNERLTVNISEFAKLAGVSKNQAYSLAATNSLGVPVIRLGKRIVLPRQAVMRLLEGETNEADTRDNIQRGEI